MASSSKRIIVAECCSVSSSFVFLCGGEVGEIYISSITVPASGCLLLSENGHCLDLGVVSGSGFPWQSFSALLTGGF